MRKRLAIGCAMARDPQILLLDEPTAALDLVCREQLLDAFEDFRRAGGLVVLVTHDEREIRTCWRLFLLRRGLLEPYAYGGDPRALLRDLEAP